MHQFLTSWPALWQTDLSNGHDSLAAQTLE